MLSEETRAAILELAKKGVRRRRIAKLLSISRGSVDEVLRSGQVEVPRIERPEMAEPFRDQIGELVLRFGGHLGRVHEELVRAGASFSYQALTGFCRRHGIGQPPKLPAGHYDFNPGQEMQHDTSPHLADIGGVKTRVQTASLVLCYSRMIFFQIYPRFTRFECKSFLAEAIAYFGGSAGTCMIDNTHVVVASGSGAQMVPAPEMEAFGHRYGFAFAAHEKGDANRSARVEAPFDRIDKGFLVGSTFADWSDLNRRARATCDDWNARRSNKLHASRRELFAAERPHLRPLPLHVPEVYQVHQRTVDAEGYIHLHRIRYSAPYILIDRTLEVHETMERVDLFHGPRKVATHRRLSGPLNSRVLDPAHRPPRGSARLPQPPSPEESALLAEPQLASYVARLRAIIGGRRAPLRRLVSMLRDYPRAPLLAAVAQAEQYGLFDLDRVERMVLKQIAHEYFIVPPEKDDPEDGDE
jgi:hypothetical protein